MPLFHGVSSLQSRAIKIIVIVEDTVSRDRLSFLRAFSNRVRVFSTFFHIVQGHFQPFLICPQLIPSLFCSPYYDKKMPLANRLRPDANTTNNLTPDE